MNLLKCFLAVSIFFSTLGWAQVGLDNPVLRLLISVLGYDMSGLLYGLDPSQAAELFKGLRSNTFDLAILALCLIASILFVWDKYPRVSACLLLFVTIIVGGSAGGCQFGFNVCALILLAIQLAELFYPAFVKKGLLRPGAQARDSLAYLWIGTFLGLIYTGAFLSKIYFSGFSWSDQSSLLSLLRIHQFLYDTGSVVSPPRDWLIEFAIRFQSLSPLLLLLVLLIESVGIFFPFLKFTLFYLSVLFVLHLAMGLVTGVFTIPIIIIICLLILYKTLKRCNERLGTKVKATVFLSALFVLALTWISPTDPRGTYGKSILFPFHHFNMFAYQANHYPYLTFKNDQDLDISLKLTRPIRTNNYYLIFFSARDPLARTSINAFAQIMCGVIKAEWNRIQQIPPDFSIWQEESALKTEEPSRKILDCKS